MSSVSDRFFPDIFLIILHIELHVKKYFKRNFKKKLKVYFVQKFQIAIFGTFENKYLSVRERLI